MIYYADCMWMMSGVVPVEADNPQEAERRVMASEGLPEDRQYVKGSFRVVNVQLPQ